ncbi:excinuclease ABC subunit UvrC [Coralloluteibacterium stylophorae]|uniref:UvrABC system protein C n=1 Tax=Coralloluteibacterium stylophorae TaxID=1776034 RepID=A0A8J7VT91_9GAMM|nr:excinuclease ABC subunit UvrC [Coralloluteibacterium stylophorae]MBS7455812.1 excinuclease ABC subunit UvrC [Coralloluteibacterium stylophorae]
MNDATVAFDGKAFVRGLTTAPGVYRMYAADDSVLYVGKAASLKKRVANYFTKALPHRTATMVAQIARMEVTVTRTPGEALLLENQLIKALKPRFNVMLRDDKSYPFILLTKETFPRIAFHRGGRAIRGRYFGPYPSAGAVRETLNVMHRLFRLRNCEDSVFRNRSRPCLQYQIGRCSGPCVGLVEAADYALDVHRAELFLEGRGNELAQELTEAMETAAGRLDFETAARLRDQLGTVRKITARQYVDGVEVEMDVLACEVREGRACVLLLAFRNGMNQGTRTFFPRLNGVGLEPDEVLSAFVAQYYADQRPPKEIVLDRTVPDQDLIEIGLSEQAGRRIEIKSSVRGDRARYLELARRNVELALASDLASNATQRMRMDALQRLLGLDAPPQRMECFDISHTMGEATVASCVVFDAEGPVRSQYRRFNIAGITGGDDYAAMRQALERRFRRAQGEGVMPDVLFIDGGPGQLAQARAVLDALSIASVEMIGIAKGEARRAGHEALIRADGRVLRPGPDSPALQLIQQIRDEAHRFAITGHRGRRQKARETSRLEDIPGIGPRRRANLLRHFGGLGGLRNAGAEEIAEVEGVNASLARRIYAALHGLEHQTDTDA